MASGSSRGLSPSREPHSVYPSRSASGDSYRTGTGGVGASGSREAEINRRRDESDPGLAGRGAGGSSTSNSTGAGGRGQHLPPINTHLQPGGRMSPSLSSPTSATYDPSSSSTVAHSHRSSLLAQPRSNNTSYRQPPSPTFAPPTSSTASPHPRSAGGTSNSHSQYLPSSRPGSSASQNKSADGHELSDRERDRGRRRGDSGASGESTSNGAGGGSVEKKRNGSTTTCAKCELPMTGQFVRALGTVYHLDCFRCQVSSQALFLPNVLLTQLLSNLDNR